MATGRDCNKLEESMSILGVLVLSKSYSFLLKNLSQTIAGKIECKLSVQQGNFHQGVPAITVIVDSGWSKITHKHT